MAKKGGRGKKVVNAGSYYKAQRGAKSGPGSKNVAETHIIGIGANRAERREVERAGPASGEEEVR